MAKLWSRRLMAATIPILSAGLQSGYSGQPLKTGQPPYNAKGKGYGKPQQWNNFGKGKKGQ
eukprot:2050817-Amphidinium_carterae.1